MSSRLQGDQSTLEAHFNGKNCPHGRRLRSYTVDNCPILCYGECITFGTSYGLMCGSEERDHQRYGGLDFLA
jgi:hypothetical protein